MSRHEGVSCDSCLKGNFRGRRYKCLVCYDYDLCASCYEGGATTTRHTTDHPVQCILTRSDFDVYYGGEALTPEQPQSYTCPHCGRMGFTDATLHDHVSSEHSDVSVEIVCPICASSQSGDPNHMTDDFAAHLALDHRTPRDFDETHGLRNVRRIPHPNRGGGSRTRRGGGNMHFGSASSTLPGLSPSGRDNMDPIADVREWMPELLSQLSSVRNRTAAQSVTSQLQQLEMQLQSTRSGFLSLSGRQTLERLPHASSRRQAEAASNKTASNANAGVLAGGGVGMLNGNAMANNNPYDPSSLLPGSSQSSSHGQESQFLLAKLPDEGSSAGGGGGSNSNAVECDRLERNMFVQELLLSTLSEQLQQANTSDDPVLLLDSLRSPEPDSQQKRSSSSSSAESSGVGGESGNQVARGASSAGGGRSSSSAASTSRGRGEGGGGGSGGGGGKSVDEQGCVRSVGGGGGVSMVTSKSCPGIPSTNVPRPGLTPSPTMSVDGRGGAGLNVGGGACGSQSGSSPPSPHSLLPTSRPPLLPHGSTVNLNEHAMGLSPRQAAQAATAMSPREAGRLNPAAAKRSMLKHLPASRGARDMEPPPH